MEEKVSRLMPGKFSAKAQAILVNRFTWLYLLLLFPVIDYGLREIVRVPVFSSLWDEGLLVLLMAVCAWRMIELNRPLPSLKVPLLAFAVLGVSYFVYSVNNLDVSIEGFRAVYQYIIAFFIGYYFLDEPRSLQRMVRIMAVVAAFIGFYGIIQYVLGVEVPASWTDSAETVRTRSFSIVQSPNILGSYMAMMSPVVLGLAFTEKGRRRLVWIGLFVIMLIAMVFTGSRGAWIAFAGAIGVFSILLDRRIFIAFIITALLGVTLVPAVKSRMLSLVNADYLAKSSQDGRIKRYQNAFDQMRTRPLFGLGLGRYGGAVAQRNYGIIYVDSYYFKTLAETGILGLGLYLWLIGSLMAGAYRIWRRKKGNKLYYLYGGMFAGLLAVVLHNAAENIFEVPFMNTFFWLLAGMLMSFPFLKESLGGEDVFLER